MAQRHEDYASIARQHARNLWESWLALQALQAEWNALDYGNTMELDPAGSNGHLTPADVGSVVFDTANAIDTLVMDIGHATNVSKLL